MGDYKFYINLLQKAHDIQLRNKQEYYKSGKYFNVFEAAKIEKKEAIHSAFLASLLNPNALHGMQDEFLKQFMLYIGFSDFPTENACVKTEEFVGENGRMDISISAEKNGIKYKVVIENKTGTEAHSHQLSKYLSSIHKENISNYKLVYLTLYGSNPKKDEDVDEKEKETGHFLTLSYKDDICNILSTVTCIENNPPYPIQEIIREYILTVKKITNQGVDKKMAEEFSNLLLKGNNMELVAELYDAREELRVKTLVDFMRILKDEFNAKGNATSIDNHTAANLESLVKSYISLKKDTWILIQVSLNKETDIYFQLVFDPDGSIWGELKSKKINLAEINEKYKKAFDSYGLIDYLNFIDVKNEAFLNFARQSSDEKKKYVSKFVTICCECIDKAIA